MGLKYSIIRTFISIITFFLMTLVDAFFKIFYKSKGKTVSKITNPLLLTPASTLAEQIRTRQVKAEDVMAAFIARTKEVNILVNAVVGEQYDKALKKAQELDRILDSLASENIAETEYSAEKKPLLGVPLSVKEAFEWKGMGLTSGLHSRKHIRSSRDASTLVNLQAAGAIPFVQTNVSELCMWFESYNSVNGCTNNAYDTSRTVGGSSGGEGCLLAAGSSVIGIGSDIGGSIRMPSFFNGVFGHKPTNGVVSNDGQFPSASEKADFLLTTGPMCRYAVDLIPCLKAMATQENLPKLKLDQEVNLSKLRVISVPDDGGSLLVSNLDPELRDIQQKVAHYLERQGAQVTVEVIPKFRFAVDMWVAKMNLSDDGPSFATLMSGTCDRKVNCFKELFKWFFGLSTHMLISIMQGIFDDYLPKWTKSTDIKESAMCDSLRSELIDRLGDDGVLLYPSHPHIAPLHNHPVFTPFNFAYTGLFNALGLPVTQCPLGLSRDGLPLGLQVVTAPNNDRLSLAVALQLEKGFGGWVNPGS